MSNTPDLTDDRAKGDFCSRYPGSAWLQIWIELAYLLLVLAASGFLLFIIGYDVAGRATSNVSPIVYFFEFPRHKPILIWLSIALAGVCGGAAFALKWLYHSVAKCVWNRDRILWRLTVPILSGVSAVFLAFMIVSGIVPFLNQKTFGSFYVALGYGFFAGYFSDNALAALQRLAKSTFGTADGKRSEGEAEKATQADDNAAR